jgi:26S proteasome regulatory subunit N1
MNYNNEFIFCCRNVKKQLAFMLARQRIPVDLANEELQNIVNNTILSEQFQNLAKELEIVEPKIPEDIYKSHLQDSLRVPVKMDTARQNLASIFVNAFVNTAFCKDKLMNVGYPEAQESNSWIYKTKDSGLISAVASIGALNLWNVDQGLSELDKYLESENVFIKSGALLGIGLLHTNIRNESDPAWALLREHLENDDEHIKSNALLGLALAYGGSGRADIAETLMPLIGDSSITVAAMAALALGHVFVGTCEGEVASCIIQTLMERDAFDLNKPVARFLCLGLSLLFTGKHEAAEAIIETLRCVEHPIGQDAIVLVQACAYAASGNVLKIQEMLQTCTVKAEEDDESTEVNDQKEVKSAVIDSFEKGHLSYAVLAIALISIAEDIGQEMSLRIFSHLMYYGSESIRKAVPLALGVLYASHPTVNIMDILSKYSHDHDKAVAVNSILAMGLVGAGTNHAKLAQMLRQLSSYYQRDVDCLFMVRIAQGLVHLGKGTMAIAPLYSQKSVLSPSGLAGLLTVLIAATDAQHLLLDTSNNGCTSHLLYFIISAMYPRFLYCLDADTLETLPVLVRVGQAVEVVGQAGKPKTITGFQTHTTPVLIAYGERAELATEQYMALSPILENFVLVRKNPDYQEE